MYQTFLSSIPHSLHNFCLTLICIMPTNKCFSFCCKDGISIEISADCNVLGTGTVHRSGQISLHFEQELPQVHAYSVSGGNLIFEMCRQNGLGITPYYFALNFNRDIGVYILSLTPN